MITDHWQGRAIDYIVPYLQGATSLIRIATGFFSIQGYSLIRGSLRGKEVHIIVGYDETSKERLREKLIEDIMAHLRRWDSENRREAVLDLVDKLQSKQLHLVERHQTGLIDARVKRQDHAKVYLIDDRVVLVGSSNLTVNGLVNNDEGLASVDEPGRVKFWLDQFEYYWTHPDTHDLTNELLTILRQWLDLRLPYDVYLRAIQALAPEDDVQAPRDNYKMPVKYQQVVVERLLRQLDSYRGAMLVASTGLGKTVMAVHTALRLHQARKIYNVLVFAPKQTHPAWQGDLDSAGVNNTIFTRDLLDFPSTKRSRKVNEIEAHLDRVDDHYLLIIDESHYFRNHERPRDGTARHAFRRLIEVVNSRNPFVLLMTATPLAKGIEDLNTQLLLLPHTGPRTNVTQSGQMTLEGFEDMMMFPEAWGVKGDEDFFEAFVNLPVCTVISTSQVARNFAQHTENGDFVDFHGEPRWLPRIEVCKVKVSMPVERQMSEALDQGYFKHKLKWFQSRGTWHWSESTIENLATIAWCSSPLALAEVVEKTINLDSDVEFVRSNDDIRRTLSPILTALREQEYQDDVKFQTLCRLLQEFRRDGRKVIVFTERHATALYLEKGLRQEIPELRIANVVKEIEPGNYQLKDFETEVAGLIQGFAPEANKSFHRVHEQSSYDVFISTDAYGAGVNLQDASVVISYDVAWTADVIIQRAGRILRLWEHPRQVYLYVFIGVFVVDMNRQRESMRVEERVNRLVSRSRQAEKFSELSVLPEADRTQYESLRNLSSVSIEEIGLADFTQIEEFTGVSRFLVHITELQNNLEYAERLPDDINSALVYPETRHRLYLLLKYEGKFHWTVYDIESDKLEDWEDGKLLDLIKCARSTPIASVHPGVIERYAQRSKALWCRMKSINQSEHVERISALYLLPEGERHTFDSILR